MTMASPAFLSQVSANALISELRPTILAQPALHHINALIDEILHLLITSSQSINPTHIRTKGIPAVFSADRSAGETTGPRALGRSAVAEAELELRSWYDANPGARRGAFGPEGQGTGVKVARAFPIEEATALLKLKCVSFSTLAPSTPPSDEYEAQVTNAWKAAGGDLSDNTLSPSGLWVTAILEHVCEHVLRQLSRVVARDSSIAVAGVQDLYVALCEDECIWGLFKRLQVKDSLENAIKSGTRQRKTTPIKHSQSQILPGSSSTYPKSSLSTSSSLRDTSIDQSRKSQSTPVEHIVASPERSRGPVATVARAVSGHQRSPSSISANTKTLVSAFNEQYESENSRRPSADEDEFDALVRSGETMKVSLTPSRLKNFDMSPNRRAPPSPTQSKYVRAVRPTQSPDIPDISTMPSNPSALIGSDPSRRQMHNRSGSGQRLVARNAATIEEHEDEEEYLGAPKPKKETLADMFASEPKEKTRRSSGSSKRVVPAVILGSPPPRESSALSTSAEVDPAGSVRKTKRNDLIVDTAAQSNPRSVKPGKSRSEAQELADFFSSTEPPPDTLAHSSPTPEEPPKSAKSFKSFMSRMTGKKGSKDNERPPMPSAFPQTAVKRQKSSQSFKSGPATVPFSSTAPMDKTGVPTALKAAGSEARSGRDLGAEGTLAVGVAALTTGAGDLSKAVSPEKRMDELKFNDTDDERKQPSRDGPSVAASASVGRAIDGEEKQEMKTSKSGRPLAVTTSSQRSVPKVSHSHATAADSQSTPTGSRSKPETKGLQGLGIDNRTVAARQESGTTLNDSTGVDDSQTSPASQQVISQAGHLHAGVGSKDEASELLENRGRVDTDGEGYPAGQRSSASAKDSQPVVDVHSPPSLAPPISTHPDEYVIVNKSDIPTPLDTQNRNETSTPLRPTPSTAANSHFASEAVSFRTASEGGDGGQVGQDMLTIDSEDKDEKEMKPHQNVERQNNSQPSIPLSDLAPLRGLLRHATTARECQLLLDAVLSQYGVPQHSYSNEPIIDSETRVAAWLLAGREGPIDYSSPTPQNVQSVLRSDESVIELDPPTETIATPALAETLTDRDLDVGVIVSNRDPGQIVDGAKVTAYEDATSTSRVGAEEWRDAVVVPGEDESNKLREEAMGK